MRTIEFKGIEVEYDERCLKSWGWQKAVMSGDNARIMGAVERLLAGRDEEYAALLSGCDPDDEDAMDEAADVMLELLQAVAAEMGGQAKN